MGLLDPSSWSKEGFAQWTYDTLDPVYGEDAPLEAVTEQVREGDYVGAGLEATSTIFVEPVIDFGLQKGSDIIEPIGEKALDLVDPLKEGLETGKDIATVGLIVGALYFLSKK